MPSSSFVPSPAVFKLLAPDSDFCDASSRARFDVSGVAVPLELPGILVVIGRLRSTPAPPGVALCGGGSCAAASILRLVGDSDEAFGVENWKKRSAVL